MPAATPAAIAAAGALVKLFRNEKAAQSRGFFYVYFNSYQRVTVTVVPTETR
jgi:hypothetical protein